MPQLNGKEDYFTGEEVVIAGISGAYPRSNNIEELKYHLYNKIDMVVDLEKTMLPDTPPRLAKLKNTDKFDADFFNLSDLQANYMDPCYRMMLEKSYEAIMDAGLHPEDLSGTDTRVYIASSFSDSERRWFFNKKNQDEGCGLMGCAKGVMANRINHYFNITGSSYNVDTACSSSLYAIEQAYRDISMGLSDSALVLTNNLCIIESVTVQFLRLGVLDPTGYCRPFNKNSGGYVRSEAVIATFLTKAKFAKRNYGELVHAKTNCDGYKVQGITYPSGDKQEQLLKEFYDECPVSPNNLAYLECHGTATRVGDFEEGNTIDKFFCTNRSTPLPVGSVKSNLGHSEPASGLCSISKVILTFENGIIPPNLYFDTPREDIPGLVNGRFFIITENTKLNGDYVGVNGFGFGGANCHVLMKRNPKVKLNSGIPNDDLPRIVTLSGRNVDAIQTLINDLTARKLDAEYVGLFHNIHRKHIKGHPYRGYAILQKHQPQLIDSKYCRMYYCKRPKWFIVGKLDQAVMQFGESMLVVPQFLNSINQFNKYLKPYHLDLFDIIKNRTLGPKNIVHLIVGCISIQMAIINLFQLLELECDHIIGYSVGELVCAYADKCLTAEEAILTAYYISLQYLFEQNNGDVGDNNINEYDLSHKELNEENSFKDFKYLQQSSALSKLFSTSKISTIKPTKWIPNLNFTTQSMKNAPLMTNLIQSMNSINLFKKNVKNIEPNALVVGLGIKSQLNQILDGDLLKAVSVTAILKSGRNDFISFLLILGELYMKGFHPQLAKLYPEIKFPVSRNTPMLSPKIKWNHTKSYFVDQDLAASGKTERAIVISFKDQRYKSLTGHVIDGRVLYPATGYLMLTWETLADLYDDVSSVEFKDVKFLRATTIPKDGQLVLNILIQKASGYFEITENDSPVVSGFILKTSEPLLKLDPIEPIVTEELLPLTTKDIYKELRLRGYNYQGEFKGIVSTDNSRKVAEIQWTGNWVTFMDNMLQVQILQEDSRYLYVPTSVKRIIINPTEHFKSIKEESETMRTITVMNYSDLSIIKGGGVEVYGLHATSINRRKPLGEAVLERQVFVPFKTETVYEKIDALRIVLQLAMENNPVVKVKIVEIDNNTEQFLAESLFKVLNDLPLIQVEIVIITQQTLENLPKNISTVTSLMPKEAEAVFVVGSKLLQDQKKFDTAVKMLKNENAFIISRENLFDSLNENVNQTFDKVVDIPFEQERLVLLRKSNSSTKTINTVIHVTQDSKFPWLDDLKNALRLSKSIILYTQNEPLNGLVGLVNCLTKEQSGINIQGVFIDDPTAPSFDAELPFYKDQLDKKLKVNIYRNGQWGCFRHLQITQTTVDVEYSYLNVTTRGDLSSLSWLELPRSNLKHLKQIYVYYAPLNFRDIMTSTGKLGIDYIVRNVAASKHMPSDVVQGLEYSGRDINGKRYMGMVARGGLANFIETDPYFLWDVPDQWSLEDAATVPVVYGTVYYSLVVHGMSKGQSVLIHAGTGGVGLAAIQVALFYGCEVFTTVGSVEKREFLKKIYPQLKDSHIGNSRDTSFEQMVMYETNGRGVDYVLNSLAEDKLFASVRCLAKHGKFLEIGKFDLSNDNKLGTEIFLRGASFHGIMLDNAMEAEPATKKLLNKLIFDGIAQGAIKPIPRELFNYTEAEKAFRHMASGKHMGKIILKIREEEQEMIAPPSKMSIVSLPKYYCNPYKTIIIIGGLGGFGLELTDWLILRSCTTIILSSRNGLKKGYQSIQVQKWRDSGINIQISTADISTKSGCTEIIKLAQKYGPVEAIFNLAVVLRDALIENQTVENFQTSFAGKAYGTQYMDEVSRKLCPDLKYFVVFSSVSCGRGNAGQTNYGMANSVMERICEKRKADGYPALAIQWGAIGEVGLVADMQESDKLLEIGGTLQQSLKSCFDALDVLLKQDEPVVASMVVAEKRFGFGAGGNFVETILNILGVRDMKTISIQSTLSELGMDSMMAVEIKQTLERDFEIFLTAKDIRNLTLNKLIEMQSSHKDDSNNDKMHQNVDAMFRLFIRQPEQVDQNIREQIIQFTTLKNEVDENDVPIIFFPGIQGQSIEFDQLSKQLEVPVYSLQYAYSLETRSIYEIAESLVEVIKLKLSKHKHFKFIAYSFGTLIVMEVMKMLEQDGYSGKCLCIDGSPIFIKTVLETKLNNPTSTEDAAFEVNVLIQLLSLFGMENQSYLVEPLEKLSDWKERAHFLITKIPETYSDNPPEYHYKLLTGLLRRFQAICNYDIPADDTLNSSFGLVRPNVQASKEISEDYELSKLTSAKTVPVTILDGDHQTILLNSDLINVIHDFFN